MRSDFRKPVALAASATLAATALVAGAAGSASAAVGRSGDTKGSTWDTHMVSVALNSTSITYGQEVTLSGYLQGKASNSADQAYHYGPDGLQVTVGAYRTADCSGTPTLSSPATTAADSLHAGAFSAAIRPNAAGPWHIQATFSGGTVTGRSYAGSASDCLPLAVAKAPSATSGSSSSASVSLGSSVDLGYRVESAYGVWGNSAAGEVRLTQLSGPGNVCPSDPSGAVSEAQGNADGSGAMDAGFSTTGSLSCTPDTPGIFEVALTYNGDANYDPSTSPVVTVTVVAPDECPAAPAIAEAYLRTLGEDLQSSDWADLKSDIASKTGKGGDFFAKYACETGYAGSVIQYIHATYGI